MIADSAHNNTCTFYEWSRNPVHAKFFRIFSLTSVLTMLVVAVVIGNALVITAILLRRRLRSATGLLLLSLGIADFMVGTMILPFSIANEVLSGYWIFGEAWCTIWLTMDIWMCTASIYNLVAISIDRYIAIIKPLKYPMLVTRFRARCAIGVVWIGSFIICSPSFFLASSIKNINQEPCKCTPTNAGRAYIIFSACSSFYVPMVIVIFVYFRIYIAARNATKSIYSGMIQVNDVSKNNDYSVSHHNALSKDSLPMLRVHHGSSVSNICSSYPLSKTNTHNKSSGARNERTKLQRDTNASLSTTKQKSGRQCAVSQLITLKGRSSRNKLIDENLNTRGKGNIAPEEFTRSPVRQNTPQPLPEERKPKPTLTKVQLKAKLKKNGLGKFMRRGERKSGCVYERRLSVEIKAAKTVAIVTGCFIFCWLGFSLLYGLGLQTNDVVWSVLFWLGYLNSALNPIIYTVFNREFRKCFKRLLICHHLNHSSTSKVSGKPISSTVCLGKKMIFQNEWPYCTI